MQFAVNVSKNGSVYQAALGEAYGLSGESEKALRTLDDLKLRSSGEIHCRVSHDGHAPAGEVTLCRSTCEPAEQGRVTFWEVGGGKGAVEEEHRSGAHVPDSEQGYVCSSVWTVCVKPTAVPGFALTPFILQKSRMRRRARTDLSGRLSDESPYRIQLDRRSEL